MTIALVVFLAPILIIINYSFKTKKELYLNSPLSLPESLNFENYVNAFKKLDLATTFSNTFLYTAISVVILALLCGTTAWAIARCKKKFFKFAYIYFVIGILIPYQALFLPIYTIGYKLHLTNTRFGIIFMYVATGVSFGVFLMTSFMSTVPLELEEAARIDGCSVFRTYFSVVLPLLKPAMATLIIMQAFQIWNDLKEDAPRAVGWCSGAWTADCLYEKAEKLRNCCVLAFHMDPPELFCADEKETEEEKAYHFREQKERREEICRLVSNGKKQETLQTMKDYFQQLKGLAPKTFAGEVYNLYMYLWNRLVLSDELLENWMEAEKILRENEIFEANNSYQMREKMKQYLERMLAFFEEQNQNPNYYAVYQVKTYLQEHCSESADIEKLAAEVGLSPNYLRSLFKEATGKTILEYNTEMRLQRAAELLKNKKNKVREVSLAVGYENVSYFGVVFQKRFGVTPNEYRKMV